ncbi:ABC transporter substrate-binding protein [Vibrio sp. WJH972]
MIDKQSTLFEITDRYPETIAVFVSNGFPQMNDQAMRTSMGKSISLANAVMMKKMDLDAFTGLLEEAISSNSNESDVTLMENKTSAADASSLNVVGILPCPIRIQLMEKWNSFLKQRQESGQPEIKHELKAASMGLDWVQKNIDGVNDPDLLPDLFLSAGFDMFFDQQRFGRYRQQGMFADFTGIDDYNSDFSGLNIKDPKKHYSILAVVPALFLINTAELGDRPMPSSWADLLDPQFENSVSLPVSDFDLFNAILLNIHKMYGDDGVRALGRSLLESMHPAEMVRSERRKQRKPAITIMPYFFSKMVKGDGPLQAVWPQDGAIISPIFMLAKSEKAEQLKDIVELFASEDVGDLLAGQGLFPSTHPKVTNVLPEAHPFMWLGWDYIEQNDLSSLIRHCETLFTAESGASAQKNCNSGGCCK